MLQICEETQNSTTRLLNLSGKIDFYGVINFKAIITKALEDQITNLLIDISHLPMLDSTSLGIIGAAHRKFTENNGRLVLIVDPESAIGELLLGSSCSTVIPVFRDRETAWASISSKGN